MQLLWTSLALATVVTLLVVGVIVANQNPGREEIRSLVATEFGLLREGLDQVSEGLAEVEARIERLESTPAPNSKGDTGPNGAALAVSGGEDGKEVGEGSNRPPAIVEPFADEMRQYVFALIQEEREVRQNERKELAAERQREIEELRKGPYEKYNLKVNSMAGVLGLDARQADRYYDLNKIYHEAFQELTKKVKWKDKESVEGYRKESQRIQEDFDRDVDGMLTADQAEVYSRLAEWSRNPKNLGYVNPPGEGRVPAVTIQGVNVGPGTYNFKASGFVGTDDDR